MAIEMRINAALIRTLREDRGWSQEHLAAVSGLSARTIQRIEAEASASKESQMALAAAFGVDVAELVARPQGAGFATPAAQPAAAVASQRVNHVLWAIGLTMAAIAMSYSFGQDLGARLSRTCEIPAAERR